MRAVLLVKGEAVINVEAGNYCLLLSSRFSAYLPSLVALVNAYNFNNVSGKKIQSNFVHSDRIFAS